MVGNEYARRPEISNLFKLTWCSQIIDKHIIITDQHADWTPVQLFISEDACDRCSSFRGIKRRKKWKPFSQDH